MPVKSIEQTNEFSKHNSRTLASSVNDLLLMANSITAFKQLTKTMTVLDELDWN
jgi:hypothetical protein